MPLIKVLFKEQFECNGHFFRGVVSHDGVAMEPVSDCMGTENAFIQFTHGGGQLLVKNRIESVSIGAGVPDPDNFVELYPAAE